MKLNPLLFGHRLHLCLFILLFVDEQFCGPIFHEEEISLFVTDLPTLINRYLFLLDHWLLFLSLLTILHFFSSDLPLSQQCLGLLLLLQLLLVHLLQLFNLGPKGLTHGGFPLGLE